MTTTTSTAPAKKATAPKPAPAKKAPAKQTASAEPKAPAKKAPAKVAESNKVDAPDLAARLTAARAAGHTCRAIAGHALPAVPLELGSDSWRLAGRVDRLSRGGAVTADELKLLTPVLDRIESGDIKVPERATRKPSVSNKAQAIHVLETAAAEKSAAGKQKLIDEALRLLGGTTK
jgi:hypothetical protein